LFVGDDYLDVDAIWDPRDSKLEDKLAKALVEVYGSDDDDDNEETDCIISTEEPDYIDYIASIGTYTKPGLFAINVVLDYFVQAWFGFREQYACSNALFGLLATEAYRWCLLSSVIVPLLKEYFDIKRLLFTRRGLSLIVRNHLTRQQYKQLTTTLDQIANSFKQYVHKVNKEYLSGLCKDSDIDKISVTLDVHNALDNLSTKWLYFPLNGTVHCSVSLVRQKSTPPLCEGTKEGFVILSFATTNTSEFARRLITTQRLLSWINEVRYNDSSRSYLPDDDYCIRKVRLCESIDTTLRTLSLLYNDLNYQTITRINELVSAAVEHFDLSAFSKPVFLHGLFSEVTVELIWKPFAVDEEYTNHYYGPLHTRTSYPQ